MFIKPGPGGPYPCLRLYLRQPPQPGEETRPCGRGLRHTGTGDDAGAGGPLSKACYPPAGSARRRTCSTSAAVPHLTARSHSAYQAPMPTPWGLIAAPKMIARIQRYAEICRNLRLAFVRGRELMHGDAVFDCAVSTFFITSTSI